jgi:hypothetical protein
MIAATAPRDTSLSLVRLIFSLAATSEAPVPTELQTHLSDVIAAAKSLSTNPHNTSGMANPESIAFALDMKKNQELADCLNQITTFDSINPTLARQVLDKMEKCSAY